MGRLGAGAITIGNCSPLQIKTFTDSLKQVNKGAGSLTWSSGASINFILYYTDKNAILNLIQIKTDGGEKHRIDYKVPIVSVPSNLGKGAVHYFVYPFSVTRYKTLYMGYGSYYFKSTQAYRHRIYYQSYLSSLLDRHYDIHCRLEKKINQLYKERPKSYYKGKPTNVGKPLNGWRKRRNTMKK